VTGGADAGALIARLPEPYLLLRVDGMIEAANAAACHVLDLPAEPAGALLGRHVADEGSGLLEYLQRCHTSGTMLPGALRLQGVEAPVHCRGCAVPRSAAPGGAAERLVLLRLDPADRAVEQFGALNRKVAELTEEAHRRRRSEDALRDAERRSAFVAEASRLLASSLDVTQTLRNVARLAVPDMADWCAVDLTTPDGGLERVAVEHPDPDRRRLAMELHQRYPPRMDSEVGVPAVLRTGRSQHMAEIPDALIEAVAVDAEHLRIIRDLRLRSFIVAPLSTAGARLGAMTFVYAESGRTYGQQDVLLLEEVARRAATAIENARLVEAIHEARDRIEEQATELEAQTEELQAQSTQLEEQAGELEHQVEAVEALNEALTTANERISAAHRESEAARKEAERASLAKSQFLAVMSHELRTPMNAILGFTDLLDAQISGPLNEAQLGQLSRVRASALHLLRLIDQVLSLARIEAGREDVVLENVDVHEVIEEVTGMMEPLAVRAGLVLQTHMPAALPQMTTDGGKLRQILVNLIGNGIKFTQEGRVDVRVRATPAELAVEIADTGQGITESDLARIFDPFEQADQSISRRVEGTGLGLSVSRQLARLLGGDVTVTSAPGDGSTFTLRLPLVADAWIEAADEPGLRPVAHGDDNTSR
jgi:signal transduction histidine kinase